MSKVSCGTQWWNPLWSPEPGVPGVSSVWAACALWLWLSCDCCGHAGVQGWLPGWEPLWRGADGGHRLWEMGQKPNLEGRNVGWGLSSGEWQGPIVIAMLMESDRNGTYQLGGRRVKTMVPTSASFPGVSSTRSLSFQHKPWNLWMNLLFIWLRCFSSCCLCAGTWSEKICVWAL